MEEIDTCARGKSSAANTGSRRTWSLKEEQVLVNALKDLVANGYKADNGFRTGYIMVLESKLKKQLPGTDLKGEPHINSKIHVWKKLYSSLRQMLINNGSGVGVMNAQHMVDASVDKWDDQIKKDPFAKKLRGKSFPFFNDWKEIFGKDGANGENAQGYADVVQPEPEPSTGGDKSQETPLFDHSEAEFQSALRPEDSSATDQNKSKKRKIIDQPTDHFIDSMSLFCEKTDTKIDEITSQMVEVAKGSGSNYDAVKKREGLYDILCRFEFLTLPMRVRVSQYFAKNSNELDLFYSFPDDAKAELLLNITGSI